GVPRAEAGRPLRGLGRGRTGRDPGGGPAEHGAVGGVRGGGPRGGRVRVAAPRCRLRGPLVGADPRLRARGCALVPGGGGTRRGRHGCVDRGSDPVGLRAGPEAGEEAGGPPGSVRRGGALLRPRLLWVRGWGPWKGRWGRRRDP